MDRVARLPFQRSHDAVANVARVRGTHFLAGQDVRRRLRLNRRVLLTSRTSIIVIEPVLGVISVTGRVEVRIADHPAERAALVLVDVSGASAPAMFGKVAIAAAVLVQLTAQVERDSALAILERPDRAEVDRTGQAHA